jgi:glycosyltransferase involved in cell wall biosynthesis
MFSAMAAAWLAPRCDVIYVWHPPLTVGVAAAIIARLRRVEFVYDVQDIWPESAVLSGLLRDGWLVRLIARLERIVYRQAGHLFVVTEGARENLMAKGVPAEKVSVMPAVIDEAVFQTAAAAERDRVRAQYGWTDRFVVLFAGNVGLVQGLDTVIDAAALLSATSPVRIVIVGDGADRERLEARARDLGALDRVQFVPRQPFATMPSLFAAADALLVHLRRSALSRLVIPTKTVAYLAAGRPLVMAMEGAAADLVTDASAGVVVTPGDATQLAQALERVRLLPEAERQAMGERGRAYARANFMRSVVIPRYEAALARVAARRRP